MYFKNHSSFIFFVNRINEIRYRANNFHADLN